MVKLNRTKVTTLYFILVRVIGLCIKAAFLWYLNHNGFKDDSYLLSLYYISLGSAMILFNNEAYFDYYKKKFDLNFTYFSVLRSKYKFVKYLLSHFILFSPIVFLYLAYITGSLTLSFFFFILIILEKIIDEILRFNLFSRNFIVWSNVFVIYTLFPILIAFILSLFYFSNIFLIYLGSLLFVILIIFLFATPTIFKRIIFITFKNLSLLSLRVYISEYKQRFFFNQLLAYLSSNILLFDKFILMTQSKSSLPSYFLISQFCNGINLLIDYFYVSTRRASYISNRLSLYQLMGNGKVILIGFLGLLICNLFIFIFADFLDHKLMTPTNVFLMSFSYLAFGISASFSQYAFWNSNKKTMILIEISFFAICFILYNILLKVTTISFILAILLSFLFAHIFRIVCYLFFVKKINVSKR